MELYKVNIARKVEFGFDDILLFAMYSTICILTFFSEFSFNKYLSIVLLGFIAIKVVRDGFGIRVSYVANENILVYTLFVTLFVMQFIKFGIILNVGLLSILSLVLSLDFMKSLELKESELHRFIIALLIAAFSLLTLKSLGGGKYTYTTGAGGILSAFVILTGFVICYASQTRIAKLGSLFFGLFLLVLSIRGPILAALVFVAISRGIGLGAALKAGIGIILLLSLVYLIAPDSRIFDFHMSGRWIHWVMIWNEFDWGRVLFGMGDYSAAGVLIDHGLGESMAAPHNELLRIFYDFGILGVVMLVLCLKKVLLVMGAEGKPYVFAMMVPLVFDNAFSYFFSFMFLFFLAGFLKDHDSVVLKEEK